MWLSILIIIYLIALGLFIRAWSRFMNLIQPREEEEDYMIGDDDTDWGDKS